MKECLNQIRKGATEISIDRSGLSDKEVDYLKKEVRRRAGKFYND